MFQVKLFVKKLFDCTLFNSCFSFGISDHCIGGVEVILFLSIMSFKSKSVGVSIMVLERRSN